MQEVRLKVPALNKTFITHFLAVALTVAVMHFAPHIVHPIKHTGPVRVVGTGLWVKDTHEGQKIYFQRPNGEVFIMEFDGSKPSFGIGAGIKDLVYHDWNRDVRHFESAQF